MREREREKKKKRISKDLENVSEIYVVTIISQKELLK